VWQIASASNYAAESRTMAFIDRYRTARRYLTGLGAVKFLSA
jgi:hypothetical protein